MPANRTSWYEIRNAAKGEPVSITIEDDIGGWGIGSAQFRSDFARIGKNEAIRLHIKSGGGSVFEGNEIANIIGAHAGTVEVTIGSICASIATVIMCAGSKVTAAKNSVVMIHEPSVYSGGGRKDHRKTSEVLDILHKNIVAAYVKKTGHSAEDIAGMMEDEKWMDAESALELGFIDAIAEEDAEDEVVDNVDLSRYKDSAPLLSRLQIENAQEWAANAGDGRRLTLQAIRNAAAHPPNKPAEKPTPPSNKHTMTPEEIAAQKAEIEKQAKAQALEIVRAQNARSKEIRDAVAMIAKRDHKDFSELADTFLNDESKTVDQFFRAVATSDKFKQTEVVGSGIELFEPLDGIKGSAGFAFVNSAEFRALGEKIARGGVHQNVSMTLTVPAFMNATQTSTSPNTLTSIEYVPGIAALGVRKLQIKDLIMPGQTNSTTIRYRREDAFANAAAAVLETGTLANVAVSVAEVDAPVKDIGGYIEMSENLLADYLAVASFINMRLPYMVERTVEDQLLNGSGSGANITGILNTSGIQTQAKGGDTNVDAIHKAITIARFVPNATQPNAQGGYEPDAIVMNPTDWQIIRLAKDSAGQYLAGGPFTGAYGNGAFSNVFSVWGKMVVVTPAIAAGTALVGAFRECSQYFQRQGITIEMTNSNGTNFVNRIVTLRAAERLALTIPQPNGFAQVTGIA